MSTSDWYSTGCDPNALSPIKSKTNSILKREEKIITINIEIDQIEWPCNDHVSFHYIVNISISKYSKRWRWWSFYHFSLNQMQFTIIMIIITILDKIACTQKPSALTQIFKALASMQMNEHLLKSLTFRIFNEEKKMKRRLININWNKRAMGELINK